MKENDMKKYLIRILVFFISIALIDALFGYACNYMNANSKGGDTQKRFYVHENMSDNVLFVGSSRCYRHYDVTLIEDILNTTCYNCGSPGQGILYNYPMLMDVFRRYLPSVVVYDVHNAFDYLEGEDNSKYIRLMRPYFSYCHPNDVASDIDDTEKYKCISNLYKYNYTVMQVIGDCIHPMQKSIKGFNPLHGCLADTSFTYHSTEIYNIDPLKIKYMNQMILRCNEKNVKLLFAISPAYRPSNLSEYDFFIDFAKSQDIVVLNHFGDSVISNNVKYFNDSGHLNEFGAKVYSSIIANEIKKFIQ